MCPAMCHMARGLTDASLNAKAKQLNEMAWFIFSKDDLAKRDLDYGMTLIRLAVERSDGKNAAILDTLARGYFEKGTAREGYQNSGQSRKAGQRPHPDRNPSHTHPLQTGAPLNLTGAGRRGTGLDCVLLKLI